jgi:hypothetical protein
MKKQGVLFVFLFIVHLILSAQVEQIKEYKYFVGEPYKATDAIESYFFSKGDTLLSVKIDKRVVIIQNYEAYEAKLLTVAHYKVLSKGTNVLGVYQQNDLYYLLYSVFINGNSNVFSREVVFSSGELKEEKKLFSVVGARDFCVYSSNNNFKILISFNELEYEQGGYYVLGDSLQIEQNENVTQKDVLSFGVNSKGDAFYIFTKFNPSIKDTKRNRENLSNYKTSCHSIPVDKKEEKMVSFSELTGNSVSVLLRENNAGHMVCSGYAQQGIFSYIIDLDNEILSVEITELPWSNQLNLKELVFTKDSCLLIIGEQYSFYKDDLIDSDGEAYVNYRNQYGYILVAKFSVSNKPEWVQSIPKIQFRKAIKPTPLHKGSMSYKFLEVSGRYTFVYLDSRVNKDLPIESSVAPYDESKPAVITVVSLNPFTGQIKKNIILDTKYVDGKRLYSFSNNKLIAISSDEFLLEMFDKKRGDVLLRVKYLGN